MQSASSATLGASTNSSLNWSQALLTILVIVALAIIAATAWVFISMRMRNASRTVASMRELLQQLDRKAQSLHKAEEAARESQRLNARRQNEVEQLRETKRHLESRVTQLETQNQALAQDATSRQEELLSLRERLAFAEAQAAHLEKSLSAANARHLSLVSRLHSDDATRVTALNTLRAPGPLRLTDAPEDLLASVDEEPIIDATDGIENIKPKEPPPPKRRPPTKRTPSAEFLLGLRPDLAISDSETDDDAHDLDADARWAAREAAAFQDDGISDIHSSIAMQRAPWADALAPARRRTPPQKASIAEALRAGSDDDAPGVFGHARKWLVDGGGGRDDVASDVVSNE